jgi:hypothetical protein
VLFTASFLLSVLQYLRNESLLLTKEQLLHCFNHEPI